MGSFDESFLEVPPEVIATSLRTHQKCFALKSIATGKLANRYLLVSNMVAKDGGKTIIEGNNKVIAARLSDAKFFWDQDRKVKLEDWAKKLDAITFHAKLGSQGERVKRIEALAGEIAKTIGANVEKAKLAARLAKADLVTGMVGEFPNCRASWAATMRWTRASTRKSPTPSATTISRWGRVTPYRFRRLGRRWLWPTSSTRYGLLVD